MIRGADLVLKTVPTTSPSITLLPKGSGKRLAFWSNLARLGATVISITEIEIGIKRYLPSFSSHLWVIEGQRSQKMTKKGKETEESVLITCVLKVSE